MKPIFLLGEAKGENEARYGAGFVGSSGLELIRMLADAEIIRLTSDDRDRIRYWYSERDPYHLDCIWRQHPEVYRSNVFQLHPPGNDLLFFCGPKATALDGWPALARSKYVRAEYEPELQRLGDELLAVDPNLIVCLGNTGLWAVSGLTGIAKLRGTTGLSTHCVSGFKYLGAYHPSAVLRQYELRPTTVMDLRKAKREADYPEVRRPHREVWIEPDLEDIERFINEHVRGCKILSVDIETSSNRITCIGFAPRADIAIVIPLDDERRPGNNYWPTQDAERRCWQLIRGVLEDRTIKKLFQNGPYDISFLWRAYGIRVLGAAQDTMLLHHALQPESLKGLGFLGSLYTDEGPWKSERKKTETIKRDE